MIQIQKRFPTEVEILMWFAGTFISGALFGMFLLWLLMD
jgi:hypothetical protein